MIQHDGSATQHSSTEPISDAEIERVIANAFDQSQNEETRRVYRSAINSFAQNIGKSAQERLAYCFARVGRQRRSLHKHIGTRF